MVALYHLLTPILALVLLNITLWLFARQDHPNGLLQDLTRLILANGDTPRWVCDNSRKIGKEIYNIKLEHFNEITNIRSPQILIVVNSPEERILIRKQLKKWNKKPVEDFWFFT